MMYSRYIQQLKSFNILMISHCNGIVFEALVGLTKFKGFDNLLKINFLKRLKNFDSNKSSSNEFKRCKTI